MDLNEIGYNLVDWIRVPGSRDQWR